MAELSEKDIYLITGGCGFIGSHIAEALVSQGRKVRLLDNLSSGHESNIEHLRGQLEFVRGDIQNRSEISKAMQGVSHLFHEAALVSVADSVESPRANHDINLTGTLNVMEAAREAGVKRVVMASSAAVYGNSPELPKREDMRPEPESPYAIGKITGEYILRVYAKLYGLETVALRYFNVYGPRQDPSSVYSGVISKFSDSLLNAECPLIFGDGKQTRDFVFVKDVVQANLKAMHSPELGGGEVFNVGSGSESSLLDLLNILKSLSGSDLRPIFRAERKGDIRHSVADIALAREKLNYLPESTLEEGLGVLLKYIRDGEA